MNLDDFNSRIQYLPIVLAAWVIALVAHEMAHAGIAYVLGDPTARRMGRLSVNPVKHLDPYGTALVVLMFLWKGWMFGWAKPVPVSPYHFKNRQRGMALVGIAGPVANFILAIMIVVIWNAVHPTAGGYAYWSFFIAFQLNIILGLFNLIPIPPLDGSRVVSAFLPRRAYEKWSAFDQYGIFVVVLVVIAFAGPLSRVYFGAMDAIAGVFLSNY